MSKHKGIFVLALLIVVALLASTVTYQVDETNDIVLVQTFYQITGKPLMGAESAGLRFKAPWPIQSITRYNARDFILEDPYEQVTTRDQQFIIVNTYCNWRIKYPVQLYKAVRESQSKAQESLRSLLMTIKANVISRHDMGDIINTDPKKMKLAEIEKEILDGRPAETNEGKTTDKIEGLAQRALRDYGIEVTKVGVKVIGLPEGVTQAVIDSQIKERILAAESYRAAGEAQAKKITSRANAASQEILSFANRRANYIQTEGQQDAARYYETFKENEPLAMFLRALASLKTELAGRAIFVMQSTQNPALKFFENGPSLEGMKTPVEAKKMMDKQAATAPATTPTMTSPGK